MKKTVSIFAACVGVLILAAPAVQQQAIPLDKSITAKNLIPATISSITEDFQPMSVHLVLRGMNFPPKNAPNNIARLVRLVTVGGTGDPNSYTFYIGQTGNWTPTVIDDVFGFSVPTGRRYRIGIVQFQETPTGINNKTLVSNEMEYLVLMNLDHVTPSPVPHLGTEVQVFVCNDVGSQGAKIVKYGGLPAQVTQWMNANGIIKIKLPLKSQVGTHDLWVEENGVVVSKKLPVQLQSIK
jgi:hypothetical protein